MSQVKDFDVTTVDTSSCPNAWKTEGEALFNLGLQRRVRRRCLLVRSLPHQGLVVRAEAEGRRRRVRTAAHERDQPVPRRGARRRKTRPTSCASAPSRASSTGRTARGRGRMPGFCVTPEEKADRGDLGRGRCQPEAGRHAGAGRDDDRRTTSARSWCTSGA